jgi:hypothetical protein
LKKKLNDVTLIAYDTRPDKIEGTILGMQKCLSRLDFASAKLLTDIEPKNLPDNIIWEYAPHINNINDFNLYVFSELGMHVETSHALYVQDHAYILDETLWSDRWLQYDYAGAVWPIVENSYLTDDGKRIRVGNGGFSLRSRKLMFAPRVLGLKLEQRQGFFNEDGNLCVYHVDKLLKYGIKYMPVEEAATFSYENPVLENNYGNMKTFGFHRNHRENE